MLRNLIAAGLLVLCGAAGEAPDLPVFDMTAPLPAPGGGFLPNGTPTKDDPDCDKCKRLTLGDAVLSALVQPLPGDFVTDAQGRSTPTPEQERAQIARSALAYRIAGAKAVSLHTEEIAAIVKRLRAKWVGTVVGYTSIKMIDPTNEDLTASVKP
jgi:hypothetical protein